jgi:hypothetical protein
MDMEVGNYTGKNRIDRKQKMMIRLQQKPTYQQKLLIPTILQHAWHGMAWYAFLPNPNLNNHISISPNMHTQGIHSYIGLCSNS